MFGGGQIVRHHRFALQLVDRVEVAGLLRDKAGSRSENGVLVKATCFRRSALLVVDPHSRVDGAVGPAMESGSTTSPD